MYAHNQFGKLIISKSDDYYETFNKLNLIVVNGDDNKIDIIHKVQKLIINGENNEIIINVSGKVENVIFRGNNNSLYCYCFDSYTRKYDYGSRNKLYIKRNEVYEDKENESDNEEKKEEYMSNTIKFNKEVNLDNCINEDSEDNDHYTGDIFDIYPPLSNLRFNLFQESAIRIISETLANKVDLESEKPDINEFLSDLIDISYKNVSKGIKTENEKCVICYESFEEKEKVKMTNCFHLFHFKCIKKWIESKANLAQTPECPICRRKL